MRLNKNFRLGALFAALLLLLPTMISAQSVVTGAISGTITDPSKAVIVGATVNLKKQRDGRDAQRQQARADYINSRS